MSHLLDVAFEESNLIELIWGGVEDYYVLVASDDQVLSIGRELDALDWVATVEIKQFQAVNLEVLTLIIVDLEHFKDATLIAHGKVSSIRREITRLCLVL